MSGHWEIYIIDADGSNIIRLTHNSADDMFPVWSPDGSRIAFVSYRDEKTELANLEGNTEIYIMNSDGSNVTKLTDSESPVGYTHHPTQPAEPPWPLTKLDARWCGRSGIMMPRPIPISPMKRIPKVLTR